MSSQKGLVSLILIIVAVVILGIAGTAGAALLGEAPTCPPSAGTARSQKEIGDALESGFVTINDGEATTLGKAYLGSKVSDLKICFTTDLGHISGKIPLGSLSPSFYVSTAVDLSGSTPKTSNLSIKVGSLPDVPVLSEQVTKKLSGLIDENLAKFQLEQKYSANFSNGSVTISK